MRYDWSGDYCSHQLLTLSDVDFLKHLSDAHALQFTNNLAIFKIKWILILRDTATRISISLFGWCQLGAFRSVNKRDTPTFLHKCRMILIDQHLRPRYLHHWILIYNSFWRPDDKLGLEIKLIRWQECIFSVIANILESHLF